MRWNGLVDGYEDGLCERQYISVCMDLDGVFKVKLFWLRWC